MYSIISYVNEKVVPTLGIEPSPSVLQTDASTRLA
jgi:hypothetical protein